MSTNHIAENVTRTSENINEAIDWLQKTGGVIQDFATEQAPLYCREVVAWEFWYGMTGGSISTAILLVGAYLVMRGVRAFKATTGDEELGAILSLVGGIVVVIGVLMLLTYAPHAIKAAISPRLVIVEHLRTLK